METNPNTIIDSLGGTSKVAALCELTSGAVSQWRHNGIPKAWMKFLQAQHPDQERAGPEADRTA